MLFIQFTLFRVFRQGDPELRIKALFQKGVRNTYDIKLNKKISSCPSCNKLRWHYSPEEIQVVLKLGVWAKTKIIDDSKLGLEIANLFMKHDMQLRKKRMVK